MFILITACRYTAISHRYKRDIAFIQQFAISCRINIKNSQMTNKMPHRISHTYSQQLKYSLLYNSTTKHALPIAEVWHYSSSFFTATSPSKTTLVVHYYWSSPCWGAEIPAWTEDGKQSPQPQGVQRAPPPDPQAHTGSVVLDVISSEWQNGRGVLLRERSGLLRAQLTAYKHGVCEKATVVCTLYDSGRQQSIFLYTAVTDWMATWLTEQHARLWYGRCDTNAEKPAEGISI